jgi:peptide/nickel transport system substrate-binding protein
MRRAQVGVDLRSIRAHVVALAAAALMAGTISACGGDQSDAGSGGGAPAAGLPVADGTVTVGSVQQITQLDPYKARIPWESVLARSLWSTLVTYDEETGQEVQPALAERWDVSEDGRTYTFHLREGLKFSNGDPLTAQHVVRTINRALDPKTQWSQAGLMPKLKSLEAVGGSEVRAVLEQPSANVFLMLLTQAPILNTADVPALAGRNPATSGPFKIKEFVPDDHVTLERNENYWGEPAPSAELRLVRAQDASAAVTSLRSGDLDALWGVPWQDVRSLESGGFPIVVSENPSGQAIGYGDYSSPPFDDVKARQALVHATDKQKIIDTAYAGEVLISNTNQPMPSTDPLFDDELPEYAFDLDKAKALFAEAGVAEGTTLTYLWSSTHGRQALTWGQILQSDLAKIGIELKIQTLEPAALAERITPVGEKTFPNVIIPSQYILPTPISMGIWLTGTCPCNYSNPEYDAAVQSADQQTDPDERARLYAEAQRIFAEDAGVMIIGQTSTPVATQENVAGIWVDPADVAHFEGARRTEDG